MDTIIILDFGSQVTQLIARRLRAMQYHAEIVPYDTPIEVLDTSMVKGIILSGGPSSVYAKNAPHADGRIFDLGRPILGICYGLQEIVYQFGGSVARGEKREYGYAKIKTSGKLFAGSPKIQTVWMSHGDTVKKIPKDFKIIATSQNSPFAAIESKERFIYAVQFHLEVSHTEY